MIDNIRGSTLDVLIDSGELDEALEVAAGIAERVEDEDVLELAQGRTAMARILAVRGQASQVTGSLEWIESTSRRTGSADYLVLGLGSCAFAWAAVGQDDRASALLTECGAAPGGRENQYYAAFLPAMVRTALAIGNRVLAEGLVEGVEPRYPYTSHALVASNAELAEDSGNLRAATDMHAQAADRWERFGVVPERAFALLAHGRCLVKLRRPTDATRVLRRARRIFDSLGAEPARSKTNLLLQQATALTS
jgi:hypothetical protein